MKIRIRSLLVASLVGLLSISRVARAENIYDDVPPMGWEDMRNCELVVAARYESHQTGNALRDEPDVKSGLTHDLKQTLTLRVDRVLKGTRVKPGDLLPVELRHWYSIETRPVEDSWRIRTQSDGIPRLCYKHQFSNPGPLSPTQIVTDVRQDILYFFPKANAPALAKSGQVASTSREDDFFRLVNGQAPSLPFRLSQGLSRKIQQDALEELDASRDPATLDVLFKWLSSPGLYNGLSDTAEASLISIGDKGGDVYNRALARLQAAPRDLLPYTKMTPADQKAYRSSFDKPDGQGARIQFLSRCAHVMAEVDGDRAARDFDRLISRGTPLLSQIAISNLGYTHSPYALDPAFRLLNSSETFTGGALALRGLLYPEYGRNSTFYSRRNRTSQTEKLIALAKPRLAQAVRLPAFDSSRTGDAYNAKDSNEVNQLRELRLYFESLVGQQSPAPVDLAHAQQILLHPEIDPKKLIVSPFESNWTPIEKEGVAVLGAIDRESDPRFIPLIVTLIHQASPWLKTQEGYRVLSHYSQMFPHAFKSELDKQGITTTFLETSLREGFPGSPSRLLSSSPAFWSFGKDDEPYFGLRAVSNDQILYAQRYKTSPALLQSLADYCTRTLPLDYTGPDISALHTLWLVDPATARPIIEQVGHQQELRLAKERAELAAPSTSPLVVTSLPAFSPRYSFASSQSRSRFLALAIADGHEEFVDELLSRFPVSLYKSPLNFTTLPSTYDLAPLLWTNNPRVFERYLQLVDAAIALPTDDSLSLWSYRSDRTRSLELIQMMFTLHPREYFDRTLSLMRSPISARREEGTGLLKKALYWDGDFDPQALSRERAAQLKTIVPVVERLASLPEVPLRVAFLRHLGVSLPKDPQKRQRFLFQLTSDPRTAVARNAIRLLELETGDYGIEFTWRLPSPQKERLWDDIVADRAQVLKDPPIPMRVDQ